MKWVIAVLILILAGVFFAIRQPSPLPTADEPSRELEPVSTSSVPARFSTATPSQSEIPDAHVSREEIERQIKIINDASMKSDLNSFQLIVEALDDARPEIRHAALDAIIQFGSRDAIPFLKEAAAKTDDAREKVKILDAIEFLNLPAHSEIRSQGRVNSVLQQ